MPNGKNGSDDHTGPRRTIARRGTEIFVVVGNQIRWSDLCMLKDDWEELVIRKKRKARSSGEAFDAESEEDEDFVEGSYRVRTSKLRCHPVN